MIPLSKRLLEYFEADTPPKEHELQKELNSRLKHIVKPCWELKFCPYGPLVEDFPLPPLIHQEHRAHNQYLKDCLITGGIGENHDIPLDNELRAFSR